MKDWKAAARNWILNAVKFATDTPKSDYNSQPKPIHFHTSIIKTMMNHCKSVRETIVVHKGFKV